MLPENIQVLTSDGFTQIKNITTDDLVATMNPDTFELMYVNPVRIYQADKQELIGIKNNQVTLICTKDHKLFVQINKKHEFHEIQRLSDDTFKLKLNVVNQNKNKIEWFVLPSYMDTNERKIPMDLWLEFIALFINYGYIRFGKIAFGNLRFGHPINIPAINDEIKKYISLIDDKQLMHYLMCCEDKFPDYIWDLNKDQTKTFLKYFLPCCIDINLHKLVSQTELVPEDTTNLDSFEYLEHKQYLRCNPKHFKTYKMLSKSVYGLEIPDTHLIYIKIQGSQPCWIGDH